MKNLTERRGVAIGGRHVVVTSIKSTYMTCMLYEVVSKYQSVCKYVCVHVKLHV